MQYIALKGLNVTSQHLLNKEREGLAPLNTLAVIVIEGLLIGLSIGAYCIGFCLPILTPHVMIGHRGVKSGFKASLLFCLGRLIAYLPLGLLLGIVGSVVIEEILPTYSAVGLSILGFFVIIYAIFTSIEEVNLKRFFPSLCPVFEGSKSSFVLGFAAALIPCFPLIAVIARALIEASVLHSVVLLISFWLGTSVYLIIIGVLSSIVGVSLELRIGMKRIRRICGYSMMIVGLLFMVEGLIAIFK